MGSLGRWLPFNAGSALGGSATKIVPDLLPRWGGGVVLAVYAFAFATAAALQTSVQRDVA
ncbi:MAG: hypothetical protein HOW97_05815 [Catenulispora sp.]|nr:hypothetical protein [Catenulispora sp.]NUR60044.1 hypothetical protein [Catenulispora sp.]